MQALTDRELVTLALADNPLAFQTLVLRHQRMVRQWLRRLGRDPTLADDLAQETFVKAWQCLQDWRGDAEFQSWLLRIAYREFLQHLRKDRSLSATLERFERLDPPLADTDSASTVPDLDRLLAVLTSEQRACMLLCFSHGYSHTEASALLGLPLGTLKSTLRRSLEQIREHFGIED